jgi:hypothetical protein
MAQSEGLEFKPQKWKKKEKKKEVVGSPQNLPGGH